MFSVTHDASDLIARSERPSRHHRGATPAPEGRTQNMAPDGRPLVLVYGAHRDFRARAALAFLEALGGHLVHPCGPRGESLGPGHPAAVVMRELGLDLDGTPREVVHLLPERWDYLVTFRDAPVPNDRRGHVVRWDCADPALYAGTRANLTQAYRTARDDARRLVADFLVALEGRRA